MSKQTGVCTLIDQSLFWTAPKAWNLRAHIAFSLRRVSQPPCRSTKCLFSNVQEETRLLVLVRTSEGAAAKHNDFATAT